MPSTFEAKIEQYSFDENGINNLKIMIMRKKEDYSMLH